MDGLPLIGKGHVSDIGKVGQTAAAALPGDGADFGKQIGMS